MSLNKIWRTSRRYTRHLYPYTWLARLTRVSGEVVCNTGVNVLAHGTSFDKDNDEPFLFRTRLEMNDDEPRSDHARVFIDPGWMCSGIFNSNQSNIWFLFNEPFLFWLLFLIGENYSRVSIFFLAVYNTNTSLTGSQRCHQQFPFNGRFPIFGSNGRSKALQR